jgi:hypothetical protein
MDAFTLTPIQILEEFVSIRTWFVVLFTAISTAFITPSALAQSGAVISGVVADAQGGATLTIGLEVRRDLKMSIEALHREAESVRPLGMGVGTDQLRDVRGDVGGPVRQQPL